MEIDRHDEENARKSDILRNCSSKGPLPTAVAKLSGSSRIIPLQKDFHFYNNFQEFKNPIAEVDEKCKTLLRNIGASENLFGKPILFPDDKDVELDEDLTIDWLVSVNEEILERFDVSLDDFKRLRENEEESGVRTMRVDDDNEENGFQMVHGKKNRKLLGGVERNAKGLEKSVKEQEVKVATKVKPKVPFHIPTLPRPQDEYKIIVNNSNQPFEHVWLQRNEDGSRFLHPLEKLSVLDFVDASNSTLEPKKPLPLEITPFKLVEEVKDLKQLAIKLRSVDEFAVDLEHNQYRSFQGLTCLMQISTRTEDFVIDTLKLRIHIGPYLRELFKDPTKRKVMHGADRDIMWLERDFGIYVCNMFDTGKASRVLKMERNSLEYLLNHFCGVEANKQYQNADWRIRPLPHEMIKYAREDTHYLLYIYDLMRIRLLESSAESENSDPPLIEVYKQSYDICTQLYEKELLTDTSYLYIYGMQDAELNAQQLAVASGLYEWRDAVARAEDESTGYVLPNRTLIELAKQMPLTANQLRRALKSKHPYVERNIGSVVSIIRHSLQNAAAFEEICKCLKERRLEMSCEASTLTSEEPEVLCSETPEIDKVSEELKNVQGSSLPRDHAVENSLASVQHKDGSNSSPRNKANEKGKVDESITYHGATSLVCGDSKSATHTIMNSSHSAEATVETLRKPTRAFGALFGNSAKRKFDPDKREKEKCKLEQIKSTVSLPFHAFSGGDENHLSKVEESAETSEVVHQEKSSAPASDSTLVDIIVLDDEDSEKPISDTALDNHVENNETGSVSVEDEPMSVSNLSSSFQKCFPSLDQAVSHKVVDKSRAWEASSQVQPFDYEAARKQVKFGKGGPPMVDGDCSVGRRERRKGSGAVVKDDGATEHPQGRRRQAFPASGNRSATFR